MPKTRFRICHNLVVAFINVLKCRFYMTESGPASHEIISNMSAKINILAWSGRHSISFHVSNKIYFMTFSCGALMSATVIYP